MVLNRIFCLLLLLGTTFVAAGQCPFASSQLPEQLVCERNLKPAPPGHPSIQVCYDAVKADIEAALTQSKDFWPADFGNYGPFFIRLAWHCAGSYRGTDGRGGCDGGRIRFNPERSWPDNGNLDKALRLLEPIKTKYGNGLSWGDLIILTGNVAIKSMGGPILGFCGGRKDDSDGSNSLVLGPTPEQIAVSPCTLNGNCSLPFGPTTVGLIYVNPAGHMADGNPSGQILYDIRRTFGAMGMNDREIVALIGGGHAFGKAHGACPTGPGPDPTASPENPWPGTCGSGPLKGKGPNAATSGFEGPWTHTPTQWSNDYFKNLLQFQWTKFTGPGGNEQWHSSSPGAAGLMMLTSDIALIRDKEFNKTVYEFAMHPENLDQAFAAAWYKLTTSDMGPRTRCRGNEVPPAQEFQMPLPAGPAKLPDFSFVRKAIRAELYKSVAEFPTDVITKPNGQVDYHGAQLIHLAWQCMSPFRITDYAGGCNGARLRFPPQSTWAENKDLDKILAFLQRVKDKFPKLSWADLIILAGTVALEEAGVPPMKMSFGRADATDGNGMAKFAPRSYPNAMIGVRDNMRVRGLTPEFAVALAGRPRSPYQQTLLGYLGSYSTTPNVFSNEFFKTLLTETWEKVNEKEYKASGKDIYVTVWDMVLLWDAEYRAIVEAFASDATFFKTVFAAAWSAFANADHFGSGREY